MEDLDTTLNQKEQLEVTIEELKTKLEDWKDKNTKIES